MYRNGRSGKRRSSSSRSTCSALLSDERKRASDGKGVCEGQGCAAGARNAPTALQQHGLYCYLVVDRQVSALVPLLRRKKLASRTQDPHHEAAAKAAANHPDTKRMQDQASGRAETLPNGVIVAQLKSANELAGPWGG